MRSPISRFTINGNSMLPTLHPNQGVLSVNWFVNPKVGDIVIIKKDGKEMIKRVQTISDREVFVQGDNKSESTDSRDFGPINKENIVGKVVYMDSRFRGNDIPCPSCDSPVIGIYGRKDAICKNCGFKLACCGEP